MMLVALGAFRFDRHKIGDFADAIAGQKASNQDICIREIHLSRSQTFLLNGSEAKRTSFVRVQQRGKDAW